MRLGILATVTGASLFDDATLTTVKQSFADVAFTGNQVIVMGIVAAVGLAALAGAGWMVVRWIKGAMSKAA